MVNAVLLHQIKNLSYGTAPVVSVHPVNATCCKLRHRKEVNTRIQNKRSNIAARTDASSGQQHDKSNTISGQPTTTEVKSETCFAYARRGSSTRWFSAA